MIWKSLKFQLVLITILFSLFVMIVILLISHIFKSDREEVIRLQTSHQVINNYLKLGEDEKDILEIFTAYIPQKSIASTELDDLQKNIDDWIEKLSEWEKILRSWEKATGRTSNTFTPSFINNKKRQADSYKQFIELLREEKNDEVRNLLIIEKEYMPEAEETITKILKGILQQLELNRQEMKSFSLAIAIPLIIALLAFLLTAFNSFRTLNSSLKHLKKGVRRISHGEFGENVSISSPLEIANLGKAFNEMQLAIMKRDEKISDDSKEIGKLNKELEMKVEASDKKIVAQNQALLRKNEELEQILHAASHDLRTPLISIQGFSEELKIACEEIHKQLTTTDPIDKDKITEIYDEEIILALSYILNGSKRMEILLEGLLRLSRMGRESLQFETVSMNALIQTIQNTLSIQIDKAKATIKVGKLHNCNADASLIEQVFTNFMTNAIKYRDPAKECIISIESEDCPDCIRYSVKDSGIGIAEENLPRIFHAFYRVDEETVDGDGVGLAIVNRAADLHNGRAYVESKSSEGCTFFIEIPKEQIL